MNEDLRPVGYVRVSTKHQKENGNLHRQDRELRALAQSKGVLLTTVFKDVRDGRKKHSKKSGLHACLRHFESGKVNVLMCTRMDRLTRCPRLLAHLMAHSIRHRWELVVFDPHSAYDFSDIRTHGFPESFAALIESFGR